MNWIEAFKEIAALVAGITGIKRCGYWNEQPYDPKGTYGEQTGLAWVEVNIPSIDELGSKSQRLMAVVSVYYLHKTFADAYHGSSNQDNALAFGQMLQTIYTTLQGTSGQNFSRLSRTAQERMDAPHPSIVLYRIDFETTMVDDSANQTTTAEASESRGMTVSFGVKPSNQDENPAFDVDG